MNDQERVNYLILALTSNNARMFADKIGVSTTSLSKLRNGDRLLANFASKILEGFPQVNEKWLLYGQGDPIKKDVEPDYEAVWEKLCKIEKDMNKILSLLEKYPK